MKKISDEQLTEIFGDTLSGFRAFYLHKCFCIAHICSKNVVRHNIET